jgi:hypothetical protein
VKAAGKRGGRGSRGSGRKARALHGGDVQYDATTGTVSINKRKANKVTSLRAAVANSLTVEVRERPSARVRTAGVRIRSRSSKMPPDQRKLAMWMNVGRWRHPVFGHWPKQSGPNQTATPAGWFDETFKRMRPRAAIDIADAISDALRKIGN